MEKADTKGLMNMVNAAYPQFMRNMSDSERKAQLILWHMMLQSDDKRIVAEVIKEHIATNKYPPTIAEVRAGIRERTMRSPDDLFKTLADESKKARTVLVEENGKFIQENNAEKIFNGLPQELKIYIETPKALSTWHKRFKEQPQQERRKFDEEIIKIQERIDIARIDKRIEGEV